jgi:hypothetical protein
MGANVVKKTMGSRPRQGACKGVNQKWNLGVTFHAPKSGRECEGMNPHTPKWVPTLRVKVSMDYQIFKRQL